MASLNKIMLIGNVGKDAELRYMGTGTAQSKFSLAVNRNFKGADGNWQEQTEWFNIIVWADLAERVSQSVVKGKQVYVEGRLQTRTWDDDQGVKHYMTEVIAQTVLMLTPREPGQGGGGNNDWGDGAPAGAGQRGNAANRGGYSGPRRGNAGDEMEVDDLPFE